MVQSVTLFGVPVPTFESIRRTLDSLQKALKSHLIREAALWGLTALALTATSALLLAHFGLHPSYCVYFGLAGFTLAGFGWLKLRQVHFPALQSVLAAARLAQVLEPRLGTGPSSAVELSDEMASNTQEPRFSER